MSITASSEPRIAGPSSVAEPLLGGIGLVAFANDWTADPTSKHHIVRRLSRTNPALWVECAGFRTPRLTSAYDRARLLKKARAFLQRSRPITDRLHVLAPPALPFPSSPSARWLNAFLYRVAIGGEQRRLGFERPPIHLAFAPQCAPNIRRLTRSFLVYYCVDRWSAFEGVDRDTIDRDEEELCRRADLVIASAEDLATRCRQYGNDVHYIPHGVDFQHFAQALEAGKLPEDIASIPQPRVGFVGLIDDWVDTELIGRLADALPFSFVLIGTPKVDLTDLQRRRNVYVLGRKPYAELPLYARGFDAALVPFRMNELTRSVNPIKLREYAAAGLPIVSSPLPEVRRCANIATCAGDTDEWIAAVRSAVRDGGDAAWRRAQSERVRSEDWDFRCAEIASLVNARAGKTGAV